MKTRLLQLWRPTRTKLASCKRQLVGLLKCLKAPRGSVIRFQCNICSKRSSFPQEELRRELWSCWHCGSTVRLRSVIHALSMELFGTSLVLSDFPHRPDLVGLCLSDWDGYAQLASKMSYKNTFYHQVPLLDITSVDPDHTTRYDFIISSEVFEHVCQPVSKAFENAYRLLKPGGVMIFTVPYVDGLTQEHFPDI